MSSLASLLPEFERILGEAGKIAVSERNVLERKLKPDGSIVTNADTAVETFLRQTLTGLLGDTGFWGEEFGLGKPEANGLWLVDPVDGTSNFSFGSPLWGVTAALMQGDQIVLGGVILPDLNETILCAKGNGVTRNGTSLAPIPSGPVQKHELVSCCDGTIRLVGATLPGKQRCGGAFVVDGTFVAGQRLRGMVCGGERLYDAAACILFAQELGGDVRYADGQPLDLPAAAAGARFTKPWLIFPADSGFYFPAR